MTYEEIQTALDGIPKLLAEKGIHRNGVEFDLRANQAPCIYISGDGAFKSQFIYGDTPEDMFAKATALIAALPDPETAKLHNHMARVADCIDKATADGIADKYVTPLRVTVKAMSDNLLAAPVAK